MKKLIPMIIAATTICASAVSSAMPFFADAPTSGNVINTLTVTGGEVGKSVNFDSAKLYLSKATTNPCDSLELAVEKSSNPFFKLYANYGSNTITSTALSWLSSLYYSSATVTCMQATFTIGTHLYQTPKIQVLSENNQYVGSTPSTETVDIP